MREDMNFMFLVYKLLVLFGMFKLNLALSKNLPPFSQLCHHAYQENKPRSLSRQGLINLFRVRELSISGISR